MGNKEVFTEGKSCDKRHLIFMIINSLVYILANLVLSTVCPKKNPL